MKTEESQGPKAESKEKQSQGSGYIFCSGYQFYGNKAQITIDVCLARQTRQPKKCRKCKYFRGAA